MVGFRAQMVGTTLAFATPMRSLVRVVALAPFMMLAACAPVAVSPHPHDVALEDGQRYEKNVDVTLKREYWIVISDPSERFFMVPRPDGDPRVVAECARGGELAALFANAKLCESATQATLARVNGLSRDEAMKASTFLHRKLAFVASEDGTRVEPYPLVTDVLDVCKTYGVDRAGALKNVCDTELGYEGKGDRPAIATLYTREESTVLAARLDDLYGVPR